MRHNHLGIKEAMKRYITYSVEFRAKKIKKKDMNIRKTFIFYSSSKTTLQH